ncbi:MAG: RnfABCDGE type electron transport complex subunit G [Candidatus Cloacimonadota bacterium]|nr:RnfABCDGE type electron transport complex subunit G [Candidatus Cloacimonadota bacterium]
MKFYLNLAFRLFLISAIAAGVLAYMNGVTLPMIEENQKQEEINARKAVLPTATEFIKQSIVLPKKEETTVPNPFIMQKEETDNTFEYYVGKDADGVIKGYTFVAKKYGYSSEIKTMVGVTTDFKIQNIKIIFQSETPGLGANCEATSFAEKFVDKSGKDMVVDKDGGEIASITGATITTRAVTDSFKDGLLSLKTALLKEDK